MHGTRIIGVAAVIGGVKSPSTKRRRAGAIAATLAIVAVAIAIKPSVLVGLVVLAALLVPLERLFPPHRQRILRAGWSTDVVHFVVNNILIAIGMIAAVVGVGLPLRLAVPASLRDAIGAQAAGLQAIEAFAIVSVLGYWTHRASHSWSWWWRFHRVHHSITQMDWLASARLHPIDSILNRATQAVVLVTFGFTGVSLGVAAVLLTLQAIFIHANVRWRFGPLRWVVATPEFHHWHHANQPDARNINFAGEFPLLDAMFGTLHLPAHQWPARYGIDEPTPDGYLLQLQWPIRTESPALT